MSRIDHSHHHPVVLLHGVCISITPYYHLWLDVSNGQSSTHSSNSSKQ